MLCEITNLETQEVIFEDVSHWAMFRSDRLPHFSIATLTGELAIYQNGVLHNKDGPACITESGTKHWYRKGKLHRLDGPALESCNVPPLGDVCSMYYIFGKHYTKDEFVEKVKSMELSKKNQQTMKADLQRSMVVLLKSIVNDLSEEITDGQLEPVEEAAHKLTASVLTTIAEYARVGSLQDLQSLVVKGYRRALLKASRGSK
jgi:hypothetical protein